MSKTTRGTVIVVQESRFKLVTDAGDGQMFILSHNSLAEPDQLAALQREQARVRVHYKDAPGVVARVATAIERI